jgi:transposase
MANSPKKYAPEFKEYVCKLIVLDGHKIVKVSKELNVPYDTLQKWVYRYKNKQKEEQANAQNQLLTASEYKEMYDVLLKEKLEIEEENEILKKAMHIFTQEKK